MALSIRRQRATDRNTRQRVAGDPTRDAGYRFGIEQPAPRSTVPRRTDTLGHAFGDALLQQVARRLQSSLRPNDTIARHGGDEFTILVDDLASAEM